MCDSSRPLNGADAEVLPVEQTYVVRLRCLYDDAERMAVRISAADERLAARLAREQHPGYYATTVEAA